MNKVFLLLFILVLIPSCAPASTPIPASTPAGPIVSPAEVVDKFYKMINDAQTEEDLLSALTLIVNESLCSPKIAPNCDTARFQTKWWPVKVAYKLYACGENIVIAEESRYPRDPGASSTPTAPKLTQFTLEQTEDGLLIADISLTQSLENNCVLAIESEN